MTKQLTHQEAEVWLLRRDPAVTNLTLSLKEDTAVLWIYSKSQGSMKGQVCRNFLNHGVRNACSTVLKYAPQIWYTLPWLYGDPHLSICPLDLRITEWDNDVRLRITEWDREVLLPLVVTWLGFNFHIVSQTWNLY